ncbi:hypothetical protein ACYZUD_31800 [Pseudomonas sp. XS1P51]
MSGLVGASPLATLETVTDNNEKLVDKDGSTFERNLNVEGEGEEDQYVEIFDGSDTLGAAQVTDGRYKKAIGPLTAKPYALVAKAQYPDGGESEPYRFTVEQTQAPYNTRVYQSDALIPDNGSTTRSWVVVRGDGEPLKEVKIKINDVIDPSPEDTNSDGKWARIINRLAIGTTYRVSAVASDDHNAESNTWTFTVRSAVADSPKG